MKKDIIKIIIKSLVIILVIFGLFIIYQIIKKLLGGSWSNVRIPDNAGVGKVYRSAAVFTPSADGVYYLEAWINNEKSPLAINVPTGSKCDGDVHASPRDRKSVPHQLPTAGTGVSESFARSNRSFA